MKMRRLLFAAGCIAGIAYLRQKVKNNPRLMGETAQRNSKSDTFGELKNDQVELSSDQSFPASDAPSWSSSVANTRH